jgi:hypothetical protein
MKKPTSKSTQSDVWGSEPEAQSTQDAAPKTQHGFEPLPEGEPHPVAKKTPTMSQAEFDLEGLMTDFPTAKELERFVFDETGIVLNLKGRANKLKYQTALDVLNGEDIDPAFIGDENPYIEKADMVPTEDIRPAPRRDTNIPAPTELQNSFHTRRVPHPDPEYRASGKKCDVTFRKYNNGMITYEILGPLDQRAHGEKIDKFGRIRPEIIKWIDPRSGEQIVQRTDGSLTPVGKNLRAMMMSMKVNNSNFWDVWIDRDIVTLTHDFQQNPWLSAE